MDHYKLLGIDRFAQESEIKSQYRKMAKVYHPDLNHNENAPEMFRMLHISFEYAMNNIIPAPIVHPKPIQTFYRVLSTDKTSGEVFKVEFDFLKIDAGTKIIFMDDMFEFALYFDHDTPLPVTVNSKLNGKSYIITIGKSNAAY
jgi:curved DNA-binding protein CbpA